jgi:hypothetical protein
MPGVTDPELDAAELALGHSLPDDYRSLIRQANGVQEMHAGAYIDIWSLERVLEAHVDDAFAHHRQAYPGLLVIGTDGAGELLAYDTRRSPFRVALVNNVSSGWHEACLQKPTVAEVLADIRSGRSFSFIEGYA